MKTGMPEMKRCSAEGLLVGMCPVGMCRVGMCRVQPAHQRWLSEGPLDNPWLGTNWSEYSPPGNSDTPGHRLA